MIDTPQIVQTDRWLTAVIRMTIPRDRLREVMGPAIREVVAAAQAQEALAGPVFSHHFRMAPDVFDFEVGVPVSHRIVPAGRVQPGELASRIVYRTVLRGDYKNLPTAWGEFESWVRAQGTRVAADLWECYVTGPESSPKPEDWRTELNWPLLADAKE